MCITTCRKYEKVCQHEKKGCEIKVCRDILKYFKFALKVPLKGDRKGTSNSPLYDWIYSGDSDTIIGEAGGVCYGIRFE